MTTEPPILTQGHAAAERPKFIRATRHYAQAVGVELQKLEWPILDESVAGDFATLRLMHEGQSSILR